jgi:hypothetical protein
VSSLNHYTITTGNNRVSPRSEVGPEAIAMCAPLLRTGEHEIPGPPGYRVRVTVDGTALAATVSRDGAPLVTAYVCPDASALAAALRATGAIPAVALTPPALLVDVHPTASGDPALEWLGDFERCLAWAFLERRA